MPGNLNVSKRRVVFQKYKDFGDLYERFSKSLNDNEDKILAYIEDQELIGVLTLQVKSQDLYLQSLGEFCKT